ncbi:hypothetical protein ACHAWF_014572 [Thalassiosira exigua]
MSFVPTPRAPLAPPLSRISSIADVNQSLVDDGLVDKEKIGGSNYFWSFPAKKDRLNELVHKETLKKADSLRSSIREAEERLADAKRGREEDKSGERAKKMARRVELTKGLAEARDELEALRQNDPKEITNLEKELRLTKRMSLEEKRQAVLGVYHRTKEVYTEKEIVALAAKAGVNQNTIADVNQSLVDDGLVDKEKIGGSDYFWSFPAKKDRLNELTHEETLKEVESLRSSIREAEA